MASSSRPFSKSVIAFESSTWGSALDCVIGDSSPLASAAATVGCINRVRSVIEPVVVNLSEFEIKLLDVSMIEQPLNRTYQVTCRRRISSPIRVHPSSSIRLSRSVIIAKSFAWAWAWCELAHIAICLWKSNGALACVKFPDSIRLKDRTSFKTYLSATTLLAVR